MTLAGGTLLVPMSRAAHAAPLTFTVTSTSGTLNDASPGNGVCATTGATPVCNLRAAIQEANANPGADTIVFNVATNARFTLANAGTSPEGYSLGLPAITEAVTIDGSTQPNAATVPVRLDGAGAIQIALLVNTGADGTVIKNLEIVRNTHAGIHLRGNGATIQGSWIGTTFNGALCASSSSCGNGTQGVLVTGQSNTVGGTTVATRNVISSNNYGVHIDPYNDNAGAAADNNTIQGNYIGTKPDGTTALGNSYGVYISVGGAGSGFEATGTSIGGSAPGAGNLLSGNYFGVLIDGGSGTIAGNTVGLDKNGNRLANTGGGVYVNAAHDLLVGGDTAGHRNIISGNDNAGVSVNGIGATTNVVVRGNYIGTAPDGTTSTIDRGNLSYGISVYNAGSGLQLIDNVIVKSSYDGIYLVGCLSCSPVGLPNATVQGNRIGLDSTGTSAGNGGRGIFAPELPGATISGNLVSGNASDGLYLANASGLTVAANRVGVDPTGELSRPNGGTGIVVESATDSAITGNQVSGNGSDGLSLNNSNGLTVQGNLVGTDGDGVQPIGNAGDGLALNGTNDGTIGGTAAGQRNVIGASGSHQVRLSGSDNNLVVGNLIGVGADGTSFLPNNPGNAYPGFFVGSDSEGITIGGTASGQANTIRNSAGPGIVLSDTTDRTSVRGNVIDGNAGLGIDLDWDGITANDPGDPDSGPNRRQNFPVLTRAAAASAGTQVHGSLNSRSSQPYTIDLYTSPTCDPSGNGEGATWLGSQPVTTDAAGNVTFILNVPSVAPFGSAVTATATDSLGQTSEFSACQTGSVIPTVSLSPVNPTVSEGVGSVTFTATLSSPPTFTPVKVTYQTADGTATAADYTPRPPTVLTFGVGETVKTFTVPINGDLLDEDDETLTVTLSEPDNTLIVAGSSTVTIVDDDAPPVLSVNDAPAVTETAGGAMQTFTVSLSAPSSKQVTLFAATNSGTAAAGADYVSLATLVTFAPGTTTQPVTVTVNDDQVDEPDETYQLDLSGPTNATIGDGLGIGTILDDDVFPTVSVAAASPTVGESGSATFNITLSQASSQAVTVTWQTLDGTASAADYAQQGPQLVSFPAGTTAQQVNVPITADALDEADETFSVVLSSPSNAFLGTSSAFETIVDDDATPGLSVSDPAVITEAPGGGTQTFVVTLSAPSGLPVTVTAGTAPATAASPGDYTALSQTLTFPPGTTTQNVVVTVLDDDLDEPDETYDVKLYSPVNAAITDGVGSATIIDDDFYPLVSISPGTATVPESGTAAFNVVLSQASNLMVQVTYQTVNGTAIGGSDYTTRTPTVLTFSPGQTSQAITVPITSDTTDEADETFLIRLTSPIHASSAPDAVVTIVDNDAAPTLLIGDRTLGAEGNSGTLNMAFNVTLSAASGQPVQVTYQTEGVDAISGVDFVGQANTLVFSPGQTSRSITVQAIGDLLDENNETFQVLLSLPVNVTINDAIGLGKILDDDETPHLSISDVSAPEGSSGGSTGFMFSVSLTAAAGRLLTVTWNTSLGTAGSSDLNQVLGAKNLTFNPGETSKTLTVSVKADVIAEPEETFFVNLLTWPGIIDDPQATGTIVNDD